MKTACDLLTQLDEEVLVKESDWMRDSYGTPDAKCLAGGLNYCASGDPRGYPDKAYDAARRAISDAILVRTKGVTGTIESFNDRYAKWPDVKWVIKRARKEVCK